MSFLVNTKSLMTAGKILLPVAGVGGGSGALIGVNENKNYYWNKWVESDSQGHHIYQDVSKKAEDWVVQTKEEYEELLKQEKEKSSKFQEENIKLKKELENTKKEKEFLAKLKLEEKESLELFRAYMESRR